MTSKKLGWKECQMTPDEILSIYENAGIIYQERKENPILLFLTLCAGMGATFLITFL